MGVLYLIIFKKIYSTLNAFRYENGPTANLNDPRNAFFFESGEKYFHQIKKSIKTYKKNKIEKKNIIKKKCKLKYHRKKITKHLFTKNKLLKNCQKYFHKFQLKNI